MKVFVCGGSGFIGSHVCDVLHARGHWVRKGCWSTMPNFQDKRFENYYGDLRGKSACAWGCRGMEAVVMCAAVTSGAKDIVENPLLHAIDNTVMNTRMMYAAYKEGVRKFVFLSSSTVYPESHSPLEEREAGVGAPPFVYSWVGQMKRYAETQGAMFANHITPSMHFTALRPANVYGPRDKFDPDKSHMVASMVRQFAEMGDDQKIEVWGDGRDARDLLYVGDLARAVVLAVEQDTQYAAYNIATGSCWTVRDVIDMLEGITGQKAEVSYNASGPRTIRKRELAMGLAKSQLGFEAQVSLEEGLRKTIMWYERNPWRGVHSE